MKAYQLTGAIVDGYQLSGWRRDKHGWYRVWLSVKGTFSGALLNTGKVAIPRKGSGKRRATTCTRLTLAPTVTAMKARCDAWLTKKLAPAARREHVASIRGQHKPVSQ